MKKYFIVIVILISLTASAQYDFDTKYFTITTKTLPEIGDLSTIALYKFSPFISKLPVSTMDEKNYRNPVDMFSVLNKNRYANNYKKIKTLNFNPIKTRNFNFVLNTVLNTPYTSFNKYEVKNTVYIDARNLNPFYFCARSTLNQSGYGN